MTKTKIHNNARIYTDSTLIAQGTYPCPKRLDLSEQSIPSSDIYINSFVIDAEKMVPDPFYREGSET